MSDSLDEECITIFSYIGSDGLSRANTNQVVLTAKEITCRLTLEKVKRRTCGSCVQCYGKDLKAHAPGSSMPISKQSHQVQHCRQILELQEVYASSCAAERPVRRA